MEELSLSSKLASRRVRVTLIDDGVDVFTSELARLSDRFFLVSVSIAQKIVIYLKNCLRIGAANNTGQTWPKVSNANDRKYFFPEVDIPDPRKNFQYNYESPDTEPFVNSGSGIACALAVDQVALIIHCVKLEVYYTKKKEKDKVEIVTGYDLERMTEHEESVRCALLSNSVTAQSVVSNTRV